MKLNLARTSWKLVQYLGIALLAAGCASSPKPVAWTIKIQKPASIEVELVGVTAREMPRLKEYSMDKYWSPGDPERQTADKLTPDPKEVSSAADGSELWVITRKNPKWKSWMSRRVDGLFVIANLPGVFEAGIDPRREYLPLDKHHWDAKKRTLELDIQPSRIRILTPENSQ